MRKEAIVLTYGTFDLFHIGHLNLLEKAKKLGNSLCVYVSTDEFQKEKGKTPTTIPFYERHKIVDSLECVDYAFEETSWAQKHQDIYDWCDKGYEVIVVMGSDWAGKFDDLPCTVVYLPRTEGISSSEIKKWIREEKRE